MALTGHQRFLWNRFPEEVAAWTELWTIGLCKLPSGVRDRTDLGKHSAPLGCKKNENRDHSRDRRERGKKGNQLMSTPYDPDIMSPVPQILSPVQKATLLHHCLSSSEQLGEVSHIAGANQSLTSPKAGPLRGHLSPQGLLCTSLFSAQDASAVLYLRTRKGKRCGLGQCCWVGPEPLRPFQPRGAYPMLTLFRIEATPILHGVGVYYMLESLFLVP